MKRIIFSSILTLISIVLFSQTGTIRGKVIDAQTGEGLIGATVVIAGSTTGTITDFDGNYNLKLDVGTYNISVSYVSYETQTFEAVEITDGEVTTINANLGEATTALEEVVVVARSRQRTESALQVMQKKSAIVLDGISAQQINKLGDSDAAGALKRVTGVAVLGGKYIFVRGLSERYTKITLNGAEIPGLDPDVNTVQMDLFPSNILETMKVHKTFSPALPTFTGGHVDIVTKDFPDEQTINFSASYGYNPQSSFNNNFLSYETGKLDNLGFDDGTREIPKIVKGNEWQIFITGADSIGDYTRAFKNNWDTKTKSSFMNQSYSLSYGNSFKLGSRTLGLIGAVSYKKDFEVFENGTIEHIGKEASSDINLTENYYSEDVKWSAMLGVNYKINTNNKIGANLLHNQNGVSATRYREGGRSTYPGGLPAMEIFNEYVERSFTAFQINGKHVLSGLNNVIIEWLSSYTNSKQNEPDVRFWYNQYNVTEGGDTTYSMMPLAAPERYYRNMDEYNWHNKITITIPTDQLIDKSKLIIGGDYIEKQRNSYQYQFKVRTNYGSPYYNGNRADFFADKNLINADNSFSPGIIYYTSNILTNDGSSYFAEEKTSSAFIMLDIPVKDKLRIIGGTKYENTELFVENKVNNDSLTWDSRYNTRWNNYQNIKDRYISGNDKITKLLPVVGVTYFAGENMNIRLNYWTSISKPAFREFAPLSYYDFKQGYRFYGNESLEASVDFNYDFRYEYFMSPGEIIAFSAFHKKLSSPIEVYAREEDENQVYYYRNGKSTSLLGLEFEIRKKLDFLSNVTKDISIGANSTFVYSRIEEESDRISEAQQIYDDLKIEGKFPTARPMFGQAPYSFNSYLLYNNSNIGIETGLVFNISGPKLIIVEKSASPNIYEMSKPQLDFNFQKSIKENIIIKFAIKNILNAESELAHVNHNIEEFNLSEPFNFLSFKDEKVAFFRTYKLGPEYTFGIALKF